MCEAKVHPRPRKLSRNVTTTAFAGATLDCETGKQTRLQTAEVWGIVAARHHWGLSSSKNGGFALLNHLQAIDIVQLRIPCSE
jgi:hypothetical protein